MTQRVLITGSSGYLGAGVARALAPAEAIGLDPVPGPHTQYVGSVANRALVEQIVRDHRVDAIVHAGALHKPQVVTHRREEFVQTNIVGPQNLLEVASASATVDRLVFTSTTSLMIDKRIRAGKAGGADRAFWIDEDLAPLAPRNIYGVTKLAAEQLCRLHHELTGLPVMVLRTARFFPEDDDQSKRIDQSGVNTKLNELLFRRLTIDDCVRAHTLALRKAPQLGFDRFIISAPTPFCRADCDELIEDAPAVVRRLFPTYEALYRRFGWTMFEAIDRVYDTARAQERLGFEVRTDYASALARIEAGEPPETVVDHDPSYRSAYPAPVE